MYTHIHIHIYSKAAFRFGSFRFLGWVLTRFRFARFSAVLLAVRFGSVQLQHIPPSIPDPPPSNPPFTSPPQPSIQPSSHSHPLHPTLHPPTPLHPALLPSIHHLLHSHHSIHTSPSSIQPPSSQPLHPALHPASIHQPNQPATPPSTPPLHPSTHPPPSSPIRQPNHPQPNTTTPHSTPQQTPPSLHHRPTVGGGCRARRQALGLVSYGCWLTLFAVYEIWGFYAFYAAAQPFGISQPDRFRHCYVRHGAPELVLLELRNLERAARRSLSSRDFRTWMLGTRAMKNLQIGYAGRLYYF